MGSICVNDNEVYRQFYEKSMNSNQQAKEFIAEQHIVVSVNKFLQGFDLWLQQHKLEEQLLERRRVEQERVQRIKAYSTLYYQEHKKQIIDNFMRWKARHRKAILSMSDDEFLVCIGYRNKKGESLLPPVFEDE